MTTPHITITENLWLNAEYAMGMSPWQIANKAIEIALAEQATEQPLITVEEARKLGAGKAEWSYNGLLWDVCCAECEYRDTFNGGLSNFKYRAIKQPEPVSPHAEPTKETLHNILKEGEVNERTDFHALVKQAADMASSPDFKSFYGLYLHASDGVWKEWKNDYCPPFQLGYAYAWRLAPQECKGESKPTCQVKSLDTGELKTMTREAAKKLQAETDAICDWFDSAGVPHREWCFGFNGTYTYKLKDKPLKQVSWTDLPMGVAVQNRIVKTPFIFLSIYKNGVACGLFDREATHSPPFDLELAPAAAQPWIAVQGSLDEEGDIEQDFAKGLLIEVHPSKEKFRITGLAEGWVMG